METLRVIITRTADAADTLLQELYSGFAGSEFKPVPICVPVRVAAFEKECLVSGTLAKLQDGEYDWLTFTSANGVLGFAHLAAQLGVSCNELVGESRIACVGKATAKVLREHGISADFIPEVQDAVHMVADWPESPWKSATARANLEPQPRILCVQGANARPTLCEGLNQRGYAAETFTVYRMEKFPAQDTLASSSEAPPSIAELPLCDVLPSLSQTHVLIATAPSFLQEISQEFSAWGGAKEDFPYVVAIGHTTGAEAQKLGLNYTVAEHPQPIYLAKAVKSVADLYFQGVKQPTHTE